MLGFIQHIDESVLYFIHVTCGNLFFDTIMPLIRNPYFWSPLYLFLLVFMWKNLGKKGLWWCAFFFVTFVFSDFISASLLKPFFHRLRPCNANLFFTIRELIPCGSGFSFPSSHATNHFGMAMFMIITLQHVYKFVTPFSLFWAILICYGQLYVCAHYPSDILGGALLGSLIGLFFGKYFNRRFGKM